MPLAELITTAPTWALGTAADGNPVVGPLASFTTLRPEQMVTVITPDDVPAGTAGEKIHVRENAQQFDVTYHTFAGLQGVYHHHGRNWILWTPDLCQFFVARGTEDWSRTWVYARFLLRHCIVSRFLHRSGYRRLHAAAGSFVQLPGGILIAGPYLSGKTYLLQALMAAGVVDALVEDDCAVVSPDWELHALLPAEHELRTTQRLPLKIVICLDETATEITAITPAQAASWALPIQASWPLSWLPGAEPVATSVVTLPTDCRCLRVPSRPDPGAVRAQFAVMW